MNLEELRTKFVELSGRYDLGTYQSGNSTPDFAISYMKSVDSIKPVAGADFYINAGISLLDNSVELSELDTQIPIQLEKGDFIGFYKARCKWIKRVFWETHPLIRREFGMDLTKPVQGIPTTFALVSFRSVLSRRLISEQNLALWFPKADYSKCGDNCTVIIINPKPNVAGQLTITGQFYSNKLVEPEDENYWSVNYPTLVVYAALYNLEASYRNSEGANDWRKILAEELKSLNVNVAMQQQEFLGDLYARI